MVSNDLLTILIPLLPLLGFISIGLLGKPLSNRAATYLACGSVLVSFVISFILFIQLLQGASRIEVTVFNWIHAGNFNASIGFLVDPLSSIMLLIITGVGFLIHVYSVGYMHDDAGYNRFFSYLNLFIFFMLMLVMGANYLVMFVGWEGVGLCSYLLIGFWFKNQEYNKAANKAFIMNRIGDLGLLLGVILIFINLGSLDYAEVFPKLASLDSGLLTLIAVLLFVGAMGKSAQIPLFTWLPDAMAGPTPVSALIHAATMVTAGVYMVARNNLLYSMSPVAMELVLVIGLVTALFAASIALTQNDIKKVLAYSTISQLGLMFVALGLGAYSAGIFHMATHAFFKALLFLGAGSVIHSLQGEQNISKMGGLKGLLPITFITFLTGVLAISGIPPFAGFFSKDEILAEAFRINYFVWGLALLTSLLTVFYMFRLLFLVFYGKPRVSEEKMHHLHEAPRSMALPLMALAILSILGGFMNVPESLFGSGWLNGFLSPVFAASESFQEASPSALSYSIEYMLMAFVLGFTALTIGIAYSRYVRKDVIPSGEGSSMSGLQKLSFHKYYIDELYDTMVVKPLFWLSTKLDEVIEKLGIDKLVNSLGDIVVQCSNGLRLFQTGRIGSYVFAMVVGIILMLAIGLINSW